MSKGDGDRYGLNTGLTRGQYITTLFRNQFNARLTDAELIKVLKIEFPESSANYRRYISMYRNKYNRGEYSCQVGIAPEIPIPEFDEHGKPTEKNKGPAPRYAWQEPERRKNSANDEYENEPEDA